MTRENATAVVVLAIVALFVVFTVASRMHEGRCRFGVGRRGLDCTYATPVAPKADSWGSRSTRPAP